MLGQWVWKLRVVWVVRGNGKEKIIKVTRLSAKKHFKRLRGKSPIFCTALDKKIDITNTYLKHIDSNSKIRKVEEIILRLLMMDLINEVLLKWELTETRNEEDFIYYRIEYTIEWELFCLILSEIKNTNKIILFSSFIK